MDRELSCFKAYDIRGSVPDELNEELAYRIGRAYTEYLNARLVCVGHDIRLTSPSLAAALAQGIQDSGADVLDLGMIGTEEIYFAAFNNDVDGGIVVTASHNPKDYNGLKLVRRGSRPISGDTGLLEIKQLAERNNFVAVSKNGASVGTKTKFESRSAYVDHLLGYIDANNFCELKIVVNAGNGGAGLIIDELEKFIPATFIKIHHQPDGHFPNGIPNPLLVENRQATSDAVQAHGADLGIAWDGDFDRCFLFDERGNFIEGYFIVGLLADAFLKKGQGEKIVHDPRLVWNTQQIVERHSGVPVMSKTGHAFIKERMREENAIYGGEMSAHHYFRDFAYCDSGMIPWLLVAELMRIRNTTLSALVADMSQSFPVSGEINRTVNDSSALLETILEDYAAGAIEVNHIDGLSIAYDDWRFNLRLSNTEPVVRLNVESRGDMDLMREKTEELLQKIEAF